jgi:hypothetical protein
MRALEPSSETVVSGQRIRWTWTWAVWPFQAISVVRKMNSGLSRNQGRVFRRLICLLKFGHDRPDHAQRHALTIRDTDMAAARAVMEVEDGVLDEFAPLRADNPRKRLLDPPYLVDAASARSRLAACPRPVFSSINSDRLRRGGRGTEPPNPVISKEDVCRSQSVEHRSDSHQRPCHRSRPVTAALQPPAGH